MKLSLFLFLLLLSLSIPCLTPISHSTPALPVREPQAVNVMAERLAVADKLVADAVANDRVPGAVLLVARHGGKVLHKAYGNAALRPHVRPMTTDTVFDVASLTKVVATTTAAGRLLEEKKLELDAPVARYLLTFEKAGGDRARITIRDLMTHAAGFPAGGAYAGKQRTTAQIIEEIAVSRKTSVPGQAFLYSDFSYITLGAVIEAVTGKTLDVYCHDTIFAPLGMRDTAYRPGPELAPRIAATTAGDDTPATRGKVHDPTAVALGGVAGHAGLFSTADDLARFCQMLLNGGEYGGVRILKPETVRLLTSKNSPFIGSPRGLGWDLDSAYSIRGALMPGSFGHTGFTGTSLWIDPNTNTFVILLANGVHATPATRAVIPLRRMVSTVVAAALEDVPLGPGLIPASLPASLEDYVAVQTGLDVLAAENFKRLEGKRVGVISNQTALDRQGRHLVDLMFQNKRVNMVALFAPEHGIWGNVNVSVKNSRDAKTGLKVYSLYDDKMPTQMRYRLTPQILMGIDTLVLDMQDVGARYSPAIATLGFALEVAARQRIKLVVLDRPNPLGGLMVEGPNLDPNFYSLAGYHNMPIAHGMTMGELARLLNTERKIGADIEVIQMPNWNRRLVFDQTGLPWSNPVPDIRNVRAASLYSGIGFLEALPVSVGRGTDAPFEVVGAPWIDGVALAENLNTRRLPGVSFSATRFTPTSNIYRGIACGGIQIMLWDRRLFRPTELGIHIADALTRLYPARINTQTLQAMRGMIGNAAIPDALAKGTAPAEIIDLWTKDVSDWRTRRTPYLLYP